MAVSCTFGLSEPLVEHMIEHVDDFLPLAPPVGLSTGPLGAVQAADREIARQTAHGRGR